MIACGRRVRFRCQADTSTHFKWCTGEQRKWWRIDRKRRPPTRINISDISLDRRRAPCNAFTPHALPCLALAARADFAQSSGSNHLRCNNFTTPHQLSPSSSACGCQPSDTLCAHAHSRGPVRLGRCTRASECTCDAGADPQIEHDEISQFNCDACAAKA